MTLPTSVPVVVAASAAWETPAPVNAHQVARRLAAAGHPVLFLESTGLRRPRLARGHDRRRAGARLRRFAAPPHAVAERLHVASPLALPGAGPAWLRRASLRALGVQAARAAARLGMERPVLWAFLPTALAMADALRARLVVYHCVDHYAANPGVDRRFVERLESRMLERADLVLATSPVLAERLARTRADVALVPNVADVELFARAAEEALPEPADLARWPRPRAVYVGNLAAYRVDPALLWGALEALGGGTLVLIGPEGLGDVEPGGPLAALGAAPRVARLGPRPQEALPAYLRHCDVALVPFLDSEHTRASLPLKLFEYLAAGLPVVARDLPNLRELAERGLVRTAGDAAAFGAAVAAALREDAAGAAARTAEARQHGWDARIVELRALAGRALRRREAAAGMIRRPGDAAP